MNDKIFIIGFGGCGRNTVNRLAESRNEIFVYRTLSIRSDGDVTERNEEQAWRKFFDPNIQAYDLVYDNLNHNSHRVVHELKSKLLGYLGTLSPEIRIGLITGLGGVLGTGAIKIFSDVLSSASKHEFACFVTMPFKFEGAKRNKVAQDALSHLDTKNARSKIFVSSNQEVLESAGSDTTFHQAFEEIDRQIYKNICANFSLPKAADASFSDDTSVTIDGLKSINEAAQAVALEPHVLRFYEMKIDKLSPTKYRSERFYNSHDLLLVHGIKYLQFQGKSFEEINDLINQGGIGYLSELMQQSRNNSDISEMPKIKRNTVENEQGANFNNANSDNVDATIAKAYKKRTFSIKKFLGYSIILPTLLCSLFLGWSFWKSFADLSDQELHATLTQPNVRVYVNDGKIDFRNCLCERTLQPEELPKNFHDALIAVEDKRFYQHPGVDFYSLARAVSSFGRMGGGSTIEMQLAKNTIVQPRRDLFRKFQELILAYRINRVFSKEDIIRLYASRVNFGNTGATQINGLRSATNYYFGKAPQEISSYEAAKLVAMLKSPIAYHPIKKRKKNHDRASLILKLMGEGSKLPKLTDAQYKKTYVKPARDRFLEEFIIDEVEKLNLANGSYRVLLTIDAVAQWQATNVLKQEIHAAKSKQVARGSLVSLNNNGEIKAIIGGQNYQTSTYNLATRAERPAASTFKIVTYLAAFEKGYKPSTIVFDDKEKLRTKHKPNNYNHSYAGSISIESCFIQSKNVCTIDIADRLVNFELSDVAQRLHITQEPVEGVNVVLGTVDTTLLRNTAAFVAIKNSGYYWEPTLIRFVLDEYGRPISTKAIIGSRVFEKSVTDNMTTLLEKVVSPQGTANAALIPNHKTYGKTGTSDDYRDAWFIGWSEHEITTGVWVGPNEGQYMRGVSGGSIPAEVFRRFNQNMFERYELCSQNFNPISDGYGRDINC